MALDLSKNKTKQSERVKWREEGMAVAFSDLILLQTAMKEKADQAPMHLLASLGQKKLQQRRNQ